MLDIPISPDLAALSVPQRMVAVMARQERLGLPTTREDFHQAEETCDLSDAQLDANIGAAKRLHKAARAATDPSQPPRDPWDFDRDYRAERVAKGAELVAPHLGAGDGECVLQLRLGGFTRREAAALWDEIIAAARLVLDARVAQISRPTEAELRRVFA